MIKIVAPKLLRKDIDAMTVLFVIIFRNKEMLKDKVLINHEMIHWRQEIETLFIGFFLLYWAFYVIARLCGKSHDDAYRNNPFEKEAYANQADLNYLNIRKPYSWA